jgi:predicted 3-demethylubiquinone-9 3-methyltransferase (glyoxalase superfamily)
MQKITTFLWFDNNAEEAMNFYTTVFKDSKIGAVHRRGADGPVFSGTFYLHGQEFYVLNGGPMFKFTEAISLFVKCQTQEEVDYFWEKLSEGGAKSQCGWLKDKFGLSWQIIPDALGELMYSGDAAKSGRVMQAMMKMSKIEIDKLEAAANG